MMALLSLHAAVEAFAAKNGEASKLLLAGRSELGELVEMAKALYAQVEKIKALIDAEVSKAGKASEDAARVKITADADLCKELLRRATQRLRPLCDKFAVKTSELAPAIHVGVGDLAAAVRAYREDTATLFVWGGLTEANFIATSLMQVRCHIYTIVNGKYQRAITIGVGALQDRHLLHTGNHYEVLTRAVADGEAVNPGLVIRTAPDGNCLYESMLVMNHEPAEGATPGMGAIRMLRRAVADRLSDGEIQAAILGMLWLGEYAGIGPKLGECMSQFAIALESDRQTRAKGKYSPGEREEAFSGAWQTKETNVGADPNPSKALANAYKNKHFGSDSKAGQHAGTREAVWGLEEKAKRIGLEVPGAFIFKFSANIGTDGAKFPNNQQSPCIRVDSVGSGQHSHPFPDDDGQPNHHDYVIDRIIACTNEGDLDGLVDVARYLTIIAAHRGEYALSNAQLKKLKAKGALPKCHFWNP